jgi:hypothetical protein
MNHYTTGVYEIQKRRREVAPGIPGMWEDIIGAIFESEEEMEEGYQWLLEECPDLVATYELRCIQVAGLGCVEEKFRNQLLRKS